MRGNEQERILRYPVDDAAVFPLDNHAHLHDRMRFAVAQMDPLETLFLIVFTLSGLIQLSTGARPGSIDAVMPELFRTIWLLLFLLGAIVALAGIFWPGRKRTDALLIESVGLGWVGVSVILYGIAQVITATQVGNIGGAIVAGPMTILLGIAFFWRHKRLQKVIERLKLI